MKAELARLKKQKSKKKRRKKKKTKSTSPKEELYIEEDKFDPNVLHGELTLVETETHTRKNSHTQMQPNLMTEKSNSSSVEHVYTTQDFQNYLDDKRGESKTGRSRKIKSKRKGKKRKPTMKRKIVVQYHTMILDAEGNEIDKKVV